MLARFPPDARLLIGCRTGNRSLHAAEALVALGYRQVAVAPQSGQNCISEHFRMHLCWLCLLFLENMKLLHHQRS
jgi:rhodanese-related sulfurtransferase